MDLYRINLNLLVAFDVLIKECHVSRAAKKLHMSQSAASKLLIQLRELFNDPLMVRTSDGMKTTKTAQDIHSRVQLFLQSAEHVFETDSKFEPLNFERKIRLGMPDSIAASILPNLMDLTEKIAPHVQLDFVSVNASELTHLLDSDQIDLAITYGYNLPDNAKAMTFSNDRPVCLTAENHPIMRCKRLTVNEYLKYEHIILKYKDEATLFGDKLLAEQGYSPRKIKMNVSSPLMVLPILSRSKLIFTIQESFAKIYADKFDLSYRPLPKFVPNIPIKIVWSPIYHNTQWHMWFRQEIKSLC